MVEVVQAITTKKDTMCLLRFIKTLIKMKLIKHRIIFDKLAYTQQIFSERRNMQQIT